MDPSHLNPIHSVLRHVQGSDEPTQGHGEWGGVKLKKKDKKGSFDEKEKIKIKDYFQLREIKTYLNEFFC